MPDPEEIIAAAFKEVGVPLRGQTHDFHQPHLMGFHAAILRQIDHPAASQIIVGGHVIANAAIQSQRHAAIFSLEIA